MKYLEGSADKLRAAERQAKEKKLRKWKSYQNTGPEVLKIKLPIYNYIIMYIAFFFFI